MTYKGWVVCCDARPMSVLFAHEAAKEFVDDYISYSDLCRDPWRITSVLLEPFHTHVTRTMKALGKTIPTP